MILGMDSLDDIMYYTCRSVFSSSFDDGIKFRNKDDALNELNRIKKKKRRYKGVIKAVGLFTFTTEMSASEEITKLE